MNEKKITFEISPKLMSCISYSNYHYEKRRRKNKSVMFLYDFYSYFITFVSIIIIIIKMMKTKYIFVTQNDPLIYIY